MMANRDLRTLVTELNLVLDLGEPLHSMLQLDQGWGHLPPNISEDMIWLAVCLSLRPNFPTKIKGNHIRRPFHIKRPGVVREHPSDYVVITKRVPPEYVAEEIKTLKAGLLGWRAIGTLK